MRIALFGLGMAWLIADAGARPYLEIAAGVPEAVDLRVGYAGELAGVELGTGLPVFAWSRLIQKDKVTPTIWNPSLACHYRYPAGAGFRIGPELETMYWRGAGDEYAAHGMDNSARWRLDAVIFKESLGAYRGFGNWFAHASLGVVQMKEFQVEVEMRGSNSGRWIPWVFGPGFALGIGRGF